VLAVAFTGKGLARTAVGIVAVGITLFVLLAVSRRLGHAKHYWLSVDFVLLLSALFAAFGGMTGRTLAQHGKLQAELVEAVEEAYVTALNVGDFVSHECSGSLPVPGTDPKNPCERVAHFVRQIRDERDRPSSMATGLGNRWDLNLCGTELPNRVRPDDWENLCKSLQDLSARQERVRAHIQNRPKGFFVSVLDRGSVLLSVLLAAVLLGARSAKFVYDLRGRDKSPQFPDGEHTNNEPDSHTQPTA